MLTRPSTRSVQSTNYNFISIQGDERTCILDLIEWHSLYFTVNETCALRLLMHVTVSDEWLFSGSLGGGLPLGRLLVCVCLFVHEHVVCVRVQKMCAFAEEHTRKHALTRKHAHTRSHTVQSAAVESESESESECSRPLWLGTGETLRLSNRGEVSRAETVKSHPAPQ